MRGVGGGETVMDDIPVTVVVLRVETGQSERGGVGHGTGQLFGTGPLLSSLVQGGDDLAGVVTEHVPGERLCRLVVKRRHIARGVLAGDRPMVSGR